MSVLDIPVIFQAMPFFITQMRLQSAASAADIQGVIVQQQNHHLQFPY